MHRYDEEKFYAYRCWGLKGYMELQMLLYTLHSYILELIGLTNSQTKLFPLDLICILTCIYI